MTALPLYRVVECNLATMFAWVVFGFKVSVSSTRLLVRAVRCAGAGRQEPRGNMMPSDSFHSAML